jgi:hypothetical protein
VRIYETGKRESGILTEGELLKGTIGCLREHEVDENQFISEPAAVYDEPLPLNIPHTDGIDISGEESGSTTEKLEPGDTTGTMVVREQFHQVGCTND